MLGEPPAEPAQLCKLDFCFALLSKGDIGLDRGDQLVIAELHGRFAISGTGLVRLETINWVLGRCLHLHVARVRAPRPS